MTESLYKKTIALLFHELDTADSIRRYLITRYAKTWQQKGSRVIVLFGAKSFVAADLVVVHVDLSLVPESYLQLAARYPIAVNGKIRDIRKTFVSRNLVQHGSDYSGPVIVKSDCNYAGMPEKRFQPQQSNHAVQLFKNPLGYLVYPSYADIPKLLLQLQGLVVEKFLPEFDQGLYHIRFYNFLGNRGNCMRIASHSPVVHINNSVKIEQLPDDPRIEKHRRELGFDYGKFDYVVRDEEIILFDTNKTTGFIGRTDDPILEEMRLYRAMGIYDYF